MTITVILSYATGMLAQPPQPHSFPADPRGPGLLVDHPVPASPPKKFELGTLLKDHDANIMHQT